MSATLAFNVSYIEQNQFCSLNQLPCITEWPLVARDIQRAPLWSAGPQMDYSIAGKSPQPSTLIKSVETKKLQKLGKEREGWGMPLKKSVNQILTSQCRE